MIKDLTEICNKSPKYIQDFIQNCTVEEKIDAHYVSVKIISKSDIQIIKNNGECINRIDLILNSIWNKMWLDWNFLHLSNKDWFDAHIGYVITMFYLPSEKPILTEYPKNLRYIFDRVIFNDTTYNPREILKDIDFPKIYNIGYKHTLDKNIIGASDIKYDDIYGTFENIIKDRSQLYAVDKPEGIIFKWKKNLYQLSYSHNRKIQVEKTSYEFVLCDFIQYCKANAYLEKITSGYTKTICNLFNDYIINWEKQNKTIQNNIDPKNLEPPYLGEAPIMSDDYIPDPVTKNLCTENVMYRSIFKILLANLKKGKDYKHCIFMNKSQVEDWNNIMKAIKIHTIYI